MTVAGLDPSHISLIQEAFHSPLLRVYTSNDPVGLEVAGAFKNVIAIAAGACAGLDLGENSKAALITRGLAEMMRFGTSVGANPLTFNGLGGVGDLLLTCSSEKRSKLHSRLQTWQGRHASRDSRRLEFRG